MNKATQARLQADKDIRLELQKEGKTFISVSIKQLITLQINNYEENFDADMRADISIYIPNYRGTSTTNQENW